MSSSTQLSGDFKVQKGVRDESFIRGSRAVVDKADVGCIMVKICAEEKSIIEPICESLGLPTPTHVMDIYKNRRSEYNQVKVWTRVDLGTCRQEDILITTGGYELINGFKTIIYNYSIENSNFSTGEKAADDIKISSAAKIEDKNAEPPFEIENPIEIKMTKPSNGLDIKPKAKSKEKKKGRLAALL